MFDGRAGTCRIGANTAALLNTAATYQLRGDPRGTPLGNKQVVNFRVIELSD